MTKIEKRLIHQRVELKSYSYILTEKVTKEVTVYVKNTIMAILALMVSYSMM